MLVVTWKHPYKHLKTVLPYVELLTLQYIDVKTTKDFEEATVPKFDIHYSFVSFSVHIDLISLHSQRGRQLTLTSDFLTVLMMNRSS